MTNRAKAWDLMQEHLHWEEDRQRFLDYLTNDYLPGSQVLEAIESYIENEI